MTSANAICELQNAGHTVVARPNPFRSLAFDGAAIAAVLGALGGRWCRSA